MSQAQAAETINLITGKTEPDRSFGINVLDTLANMTFLTLTSGYIVLSCNTKCGVHLDAFVYLLFIGCVCSIITNILLYIFKMKAIFSFFMVCFGLYQNLLGIYALIQHYRGKNNCGALAPELNLLAFAFGWFVVVSLVLGVVKGVYIGGAAALNVRKINAGVELESLGQT